jgi:hypothetical protein
MKVSGCYQPNVSLCYPLILHDIGRWEGSNCGCMSWIWMRIQVRL